MLPSDARIRPTKAKLAIEYLEIDSRVKSNNFESDTTSSYVILLRSVDDARKYSYIKVDASYFVSNLEPERPGASRPRIAHECHWYGLVLLPAASLVTPHNCMTGKP